MFLAVDAQRLKPLAEGRAAREEDVKDFLDRVHRLQFIRVDPLGG
jgi:hypothetical protein